MEPGDTYMTTYVRAPGTYSTPMLEVGWGQAQSTRELPNPQDGDTYSVEMRLASGSLVAAAAGTATYVVKHPNGICCPPACLIGTITEYPDGGGDQ
jgi:hypothetical protein